jgi:F-type H+-transporting ATPase subunit b
MLVDWFTVAAQVINFLILVWLLKRYLYKPILDAIDAREKRIAQELASADAKKAKAKKERDAFKRKNEDFDEQRASLLAKVADEAKAEHKRLIQEARQAADDLSTKRREALLKQAQTLNKAVTARAAQEVFAIARKTLNDLAAVSLEDRMTDVFVHRLRELGTTEKATLAKSITAANNQALVRSAFDQSQQQRTAIQTALNDVFESDVDVTFETAPELISGVALIAGGQKLAWSIDDYLGSLEAGVSTLVEGHTRPRAKSSPPTVAAETAARSH